MTKRLMLWVAGALAFVAPEGFVRAYWISGGRAGYTACDRTHLVRPVDGCGAAQVATVPFWTGWGALGLFLVLFSLVVWAARRPGSSAAAGSAWAAAAAMATAAFPLHLLFELPAAAMGHPTDWRDISARLALLLGAALFVGLATSTGPLASPRTQAYRPVAPWAKRAAYIAVALPLVGWAIPHTLWMLDVPFGISSSELEDGEQGISLQAAMAITYVPPIAGLLTLGLAQRWGQIFPRWFPVLGGRPVPRLLALIPAGTVAIALSAYGVQPDRHDPVVGGRERDLVERAAGMGCRVDNLRFPRVGCCARCHRARLPPNHQSTDTS
jgi:hypothetical protein